MNGVPVLPGGGPQQALIAALSRAGGSRFTGANPFGAGFQSTPMQQLSPGYQFHNPSSEDEVNPNAPDYSQGGGGNYGQNPYPFQPRPLGGYQGFPHQGQAPNAGGLDALKQLLMQGGGHQLPLNLNQGQNPVDNHHNMVNMAQSLARALAQQHTAGLRRYQSYGRG